MGRENNGLGEKRIKKKKKKKKMCVFEEGEEGRPVKTISKMSAAFPAKEVVGRQEW